MKLLVIDIQGFNLPEFYPKEITFVSGQQRSHYLVKPPLQYRELSDDIKTQVRYLESYYHGLKYSSGYVTDTDLDEILRNHLFNSGLIDALYVKGHQKKEFLEKRLNDLRETSTPSIINVEHLNGAVIEEPPNFQKDIPLCLYHKNSNSKFMCSLRNSLKLYDWLYSNLPK